MSLFGIPTSSIAGRLRRLLPFGRSRRVLVPPPDMLFRSTGNTDQGWYVSSGDRSVREFAEVLSACGHSITEFRSILDFGCGCGRILRALRKNLPKARLHGSDQDRPSVAWLDSQYPDIQMRENGPLPPLAFDAESFDLVLSFSVFTHLDEAFQDAWLDELHRVTSPGAILLLTVHGTKHWEKTVDQHEGFLKSKERPAVIAQFREHGFSFWSDDGWGVHFPDFYHSTWHSSEYIHRHWTKWFRVLDIFPEKALGNQDIVALVRE